ncbi:hypothetical protein SM124_12145 [Bacillus sp. 31A1R]|uniref:Uncharacterized protein n=1 Tax=Robertmurraya mangrovi TaxID=3098077 RepID=A0ABU5IZF3_9BACI|nr:hypothetical protein [Bacillus sp. 31A1R]MDZ5472501.1 hypothetical protein [Bacillus sp. 31A1R]
MNKNRYLLCLLVCGMMLYYAVPNLSVFSEGPSGIFAISWLVLALFVIAGNLSALLYAPKKSNVRAERTLKQVRKRLRSN